MHQPAEVAQTAADQAAEAAPRPHSAGARWLVVLAAAILVIGPLLGTGLHRERARWRIAAGLEHWLNHDLTAALAELDAAAELDPDLTQVYALRSQWRIYAEDYAGALADAEQVLRATPGNMRGVQLKGDALVYLGRAADAAKLWAEFAAVPPSQYDIADPALLNGVAYYRALGVEDLDIAWAEINAALKQLNEMSDFARSQEAWRSSQVALLDTRGYIRYLRGDNKGALEDLGPAVLGAERQRQEQHLDKYTAVRLGMVDPRTVAWQLKEVDRTAAVIRYHRALVLESLGRDEEAAKDFRRVRELGFEPDERLF
jgi:tetratricopeptide (TPR) repeat protein